MAWVIDSVHSEINFSVRHMMISTARGRFEKFSGTVNFDEATPANSTVDVQIERRASTPRSSARRALEIADFLMRPSTLI